jgi:hypothetical protein
MPKHQHKSNRLIPYFSLKQIPPDPTSGATLSRLHLLLPHSALSEVNYFFRIARMTLFSS